MTHGWKNILPGIVGSMYDLNTLLILVKIHPDWVNGGPGEIWIVSKSNYCKNGFERVNEIWNTCFQAMNFMY